MRWTLCILTFLYLFAIFRYLYPVLPCYNPFEIESMPPRCFLRGKTKLRHASNS